ncbi:MAG: hypothetical protein R3C99_07785 [Pirellulaceae bacterium]
MAVSEWASAAGESCCDKTGGSGRQIGRSAGEVAASARRMLVSGHEAGRSAVGKAASAWRMPRLLGELAIPVDKWLVPLGKSAAPLSEWRLPLHKRVIPAAERGIRRAEGLIPRAEDTVRLSGNLRSTSGIGDFDDRRYETSGLASGVYQFRVSPNSLGNGPAERAGVGECAPVDQLPGPPLGGV